MVGTPSAPGITPRALRRLFGLLDAEAAKGSLGVDAKVEVCMVELYLDVLVDLLWAAEHPRGRPEDAPKLEIKKDERGCVCRERAAVGQWRGPRV